MSELIRAAGGVVYSYDPEGALRILLISDRYGARTLPKGHLEPGESDEEAAVREIVEETCVVCTLERLLARVRYPIYKKSLWRDKEVTYFLASAPYSIPIPAIEEGITAAEWILPDEVLRSLAYAQVREVVRQALSILRP